MDVKFEEYYEAQQRRLQELRARIASQRRAMEPESAPVLDTSLSAHDVKETNLETAQLSATAWRSLNTALLSFSEEEERLNADAQSMRDAEARLDERQRAAVKRKSLLLASLHTIAAQEESLQAEEEQLKRDDTTEKERWNETQEKLSNFEKRVQQMQETRVAKRLLVEKHREALATQCEQQDEAERRAKAAVVALQKRIAEIDQSVQEKMDALADQERMVQAAEERQRAAVASRLARLRAWLSDSHH